MSVPPRLAVWLLRRVAPSAKRSEVEGDLFENFGAWLTNGRWRARFRFWREVLLVLLWRVAGAWRKKRDGIALNGLRFAGTDRSSGMPGHRSGAIQPLAQDIRYGVRTLAKNPSFAIVAVLILGLAIGANSTMFTLVNSLFLQTPPAISEPGQLVALALSDDGEPIEYFSYPDYEFYRDNNDVFSDILAYGRVRPGVDLAAVQAHIRVLQSRWESAFASWIESTFDEDNEPYRVTLAQRFHLTQRQAEQLRQFLPRSFWLCAPFYS